MGSFCLLWFCGDFFLIFVCAMIGFMSMTSICGGVCFVIVVFVYVFRATSFFCCVLWLSCCSIMFVLRGGARWVWGGP